jgi:hypothetical protein
LFGIPPGCPRGRRCRFSDSDFNLLTIHHPDAADRGGIAMPPGVNTTGAVTCPDGQSCKYDGSQRFRIVFKLDPFMGQAVSKVGRTTGLTKGTVGRTCTSEPVPEGILLCQDHASYADREGDSGSPVFTPLFNSRFVVLDGVLWGEDPRSHDRLFSPISGVQRDLGTLTVCTPLFDDFSVC